MILKALYDYYQILRDDPTIEIAEPGYSNAPVSHALNISLQGNLLDIIPLVVRDQNGKERPRRMNVPEQIKRSVNIASNFMCDNPVYVLGLTDKESKDPDYEKKRFEEFRKHNINILFKVDSPIAHAVINFLRKHDPDKATEQPVIASHLESLVQGSNLIFQVEGKNAHDDPKIRRAWEDYHLGRDALEMQCLVTGEIEPVARLHPDIKGVPGAQTKGASLVSFNLDAFTSYGREQGLNSPISQKVASGYGVALNYLLSNQNSNRKIYFGDTTIVYWADTPDKRYYSTFYNLLNPEYQQSDEPIEEIKDKRKRAIDIEKTLGDVAEKVKHIKAIDLSALNKGLDKDINFYILGLSPNASRLSIRFFLTDTFGNFADRIMQHYIDLQIEKEYANQSTYISPYRIIAECVSPKVSKREEEVKKSFSLLAGSFMRSILMGKPYPEGLYTSILNRIRHDIDESNENSKIHSSKINYIRVSYIKAHLIRKYRMHDENYLYKEALQMSLNESYNNPAYVLGRLFAVLEKAQQDALGKNINATIKDRYFTSASATPASVFPILLRISNHWTNKAEYGGNADRKIQELLNMLDAQAFPKQFSLDEQGIFILGYYHQRTKLYTKNASNGSATKTESDE